jgi:D-inositol-3-phosphate glycosyltransferase
VGGPAEDDLADDPEARRLLAVAEAHGVCDRVHLLGRMPHADMPNVLSSADVVVCTPWYEPLGIVPLEAMATGRPVIASAVGAMLDTVVDGMTGSLVPPCNPAAFTESAHRLLADRTSRIGFGIAGRDRACSRYSWDRVAIDTLHVYEQIVGRMATRAAHDRTTRHFKSATTD